MRWLVVGWLLNHQQSPAIERDYTIGKKPKKQKVKAAPAPAAAVTAEDEVAKAAGDDERRRLRSQTGRTQSVTSQRSSILG